MTEVSLSKSGLTVPLSSGNTYFNYYWLRDACPSCIDGQTRERTFDVASLPELPCARAAHLEEDALVIEWQAEESKVSHIPLTVLVLRPSISVGAQRTPRVCRESCGTRTMCRILLACRKKPP